MTKGSIQNRDSFLENVASKLGRSRQKSVEKPQWTYKPQWEVYKEASQDHLLEVFKEACGKVHTIVKETTFNNLSQDLADMVNEFEAGPIVISKDSRFEQYGLHENLSAEQVYQWDVSLGKENIEFASKANIGISFSDITLAESGTTVFLTNKDQARSISLLPKTSIVIIPKSSLVPRLTQATKAIEERIQKGEEINSYINMISGPSNSADIEMNLVVGVHGPVRVGYLVVEDR